MKRVPTLEQVKSAVRKTGIKLKCGDFGSKEKGCLLTALYFAAKPKIVKVDERDIRDWADETYGEDTTQSIIDGFDDPVTTTYQNIFENKNPRHVEALTLGMTCKKLRKELNEHATSND